MSTSNHAVKEEIELNQNSKMSQAKIDFEMGLRYLNNIEFATANLKIALSYITAAAEAGLPDAQCVLGNFYEMGVEVKANPNTAVHYYNLAASKNYAPAESELARCYLYGIGVPKDVKKVKELLEKAAEKGARQAYVLLGICYKEGLEVSQDLSKACAYFLAAAQAKSSLGQYYLAKCYLEGYGVSKDEAQGVSLLRKAADQGLALACHELATCSEQGRGVEKSLSEADKQKAITEASVPCLVLEGPFVFSNTNYIIPSTGKGFAFIDYANGGGSETWNAPKEDRVFIGYNDHLQDLKEEWMKYLGADQESDTITPQQRHIHGKEGTGKSRLVSQYFMQSEALYSLRIWFTANSVSHLEQQYLKLAEDLGYQDHLRAKIFGTSLSDDIAHNREGAIAYVKYWFQINSNWLIVYDNVNNYQEIKDLLPVGRGHIIITSRSSDPSLQVKKRLISPGLSAKEILDLITARLKPSLLKTEMHSKSLAEKLDYVPGNISKACRYMNTHNISIEAFLKHFAKYQTEISKQSKELHSHVPEAVAKTNVLTDLTLHTDQILNQYNLGIDYLVGANGAEQNTQKALTHLRVAVTHKLPKAQHLFGHIFEKGIGVLPNPKIAARYYTLASNQNYADATCELGRCYLYGIGVTKNAEEAVKYFEKAKLLNARYADYYLSICYREGLGVISNPNKAASYITTAVINRVPEALYAVGKDLISSQNRDSKHLGRDYLERAASQKLAFAHQALSLFYAAEKNLEKAEHFKANAEFLKTQTILPLDSTLLLNITILLPHKLKKTPFVEEIENGSSPIWNKPKQTVFVGREAPLLELKNFMQKASAVNNKNTQNIWLHGMRGIGKTQFVSNFILSTQNSYLFTAWFSAENAEVLSQQYFEFAKATGFKGNNVQEAISYTKLFFENKNCLLVYDNVSIDTYLKIASFLPNNKYIIISHSKLCSGLYKKITLPLFSVDESTTLINYYCDSKQITEAKMLANTLEYLPLAIAQAAIYIKEKSITIQQYLELYKTQKKALLEFHLPEVMPHKSVASTWVNDINQLINQFKTNRENLCVILQHLMVLVALLNTNDLIEKDSLYECLKAKFSNLDEMSFNKIISSLDQRFSLIDIINSNIFMHSLVRTVLIEFNLPNILMDTEKLKINENLLSIKTTLMDAFPLTCYSINKKKFYTVIRVTNYTPLVTENNSIAIAPAAAAAAQSAGRANVLTSFNDQKMGKVGEKPKAISEKNRVTLNIEEKLTLLFDKSIKLTHLQFKHYCILFPSSTSFDFVQKCADKLRNLGIDAEAIPPKALNNSIKMDARLVINEFLEMILKKLEVTAASPNALFGAGNKGSIAPIVSFGNQNESSLVESYKL